MMRYRKSLSAICFADLTLTAFLWMAPAAAQCNGVFQNNTACGNITGAPNTPRPIPLTSFPANAPGGTSGQIQYNTGAGTFGGFTASGDATINTATGVVKNTGLNGQVIPTGISANCLQVNALGQPSGSGFACTPTTSSATGNVSVTGALCFQTIGLSGGFNTITLPSSTAGFVDGCVVAFYNAETWGSGRGKLFGGGIGGVLPANLTPGQNILWPTALTAIQVRGGAFITYLPEGKTNLPSGAVNFNTNFALGADTTDGLSTGAGALRTAQHAIDLSCQEFSFNTAVQTLYTIKPVANNNDTQGVHYACHGETGANGGAAINIACGTGATFNTTNTDAFAIEVKATVSISACVFQASGTVTGIGTSRPADGLRADYGAIIIAGGNTFAVASGGQLSADNGGLIQDIGNNIITNGAGSHYHTVNGGNINTGHLSIVTTTTIQAGATVNFTSGFAFAEAGGNIHTPNVIYPLGAGATVNGTKAAVSGNGAIATDTGTSGCNSSYYPGSVNGTVPTPQCS